MLNLLILLQHCTGVNFSEFLLGMHRKIAFHHPIVILRLSFQYIADGATLVFSKIKDLYPILHGKATSKVDDHFLANYF